MLPWIVLLPAALRGWLARIVGLRWARIGRFDLVVPAAIVIVVWATAPQLGRDAWGVPFWVVWIVATGAIVIPLRLWPRLRRTAATPGAAATPATPGATPGAGRVMGPTTLGLTLVVGIVVSWVIYDILFWGQTIQLYDLRVYLGSAARWLDGGQPYLTAPLTAWPATPQSDYFLYPPPLLPVFAALSRLPGGPVDVGWVAFLMACAYKAYRLLGLSRTWSVALLAFPPVAIGFESGNVASLTFLLFAAGFRTGGTLIVDGFFKVQTGLPALWLVRQRRWRGILAGTAAVAVIVLVTLPLVGLDSWRTWWEGLSYRAESQIAVPSLYGYSYARDLSGYVYTGISVVLVGVALLLRGRSGLAALGLASIFASPALWPHGFVFALPALLMFENGALLWMGLGASAVGSNMWQLFWGGWIAVLAARRLPSGWLHPLDGTDGPWPSPIGRGVTGRRSTGPSIPPTFRVSAAEPGGSSPLHPVP